MLFSAQIENAWRYPFRTCSVLALGYGAMAALSNLYKDQGSLPEQNFSLLAFLGVASAAIIIKQRAVLFTPVGIQRARVKAHYCCAVVAFGLSNMISILNLSIYCGPIFYGLLQLFITNQALLYASLILSVLLCASLLFWSERDEISKSWLRDYKPAVEALKFTDEEIELMRGLIDARHLDPDLFFCPISRDIMRHPVRIEGQPRQRVYEYQYAKRLRVNPFTRASLGDSPKLLEAEDIRELLFLLYVAAKTGDYAELDAALGQEMQVFSAV